MKLPYPTPSSAEVSRRMRRNRRRDSTAELAVRSELHGRGLRFRVDRPIHLRERVVRPDIVFGKAKLAVFIDGCFWHRCPQHGNAPRTNSAYWGPKLEQNVIRDRIVDLALVEEQWRVIRAWEHEAPGDVADKVAAALLA
jgi:DNA mismatch endonuclease (patch repair protein)